MTAPFRLEFANVGDALCVRVAQETELGAGLAALRLWPSRPVVVVVGGADGIEEPEMALLRPLFVEGIVPVMERLGAAGVDGGTSAGVMRLFGEARAGTRVPLVGVVAAGTVRLPGMRAPRPDAPDLEPHHTHFVVVPGDRWGAESPWISRTASAIAGAAPSVTVLVNGGDVAYSDVERSVHAGRPVVVVAGSGRAADQLANAAAGEAVDERDVALTASGFLHSVPADEPEILATQLSALLG